MAPDPFAGGMDAALSSMDSKVEIRPCTSVLDAVSLTTAIPKAPNQRTPRALTTPSRFFGESRAGFDNGARCSPRVL